MLLSTALTDLLAVEHPVMLAGMGGVSLPALVAAVSEAGGFGTLGTGLLATTLEADMAAVRSLTTKPFGVDMLLPSGDDEELDDVVDLIIAGGASVFVAAVGVPSRAVVDRLHVGGVLVSVASPNVARALSFLPSFILSHTHIAFSPPPQVGNMVASVAHARKALTRGVDFIICQGSEAGGHTGTVALFPLLPQVVDLVAGRVPVVAAGGIYDGRGLAAALALGADGVWCGTRFVMTVEANCVRGYKERCLVANSEATTVSRAYTGKTCRVLRNAWTREWSTPEMQAKIKKMPLQTMVAVQANAFHLSLGEEYVGELDLDREFMPIGQVVGAIDSILSAGDVVKEMVTLAASTLDGLARFRSKL